MTLAQLRYFCTAARYHSITQASKALFVTQPTISIAIRDLEKELSVTLFAHSGNRLSLTEEGEIFYDKASVILSECDDLLSEYASPDRAKPVVRLGIPPMLSTLFFPDLVKAFHKEHPEIWLELLEYGSVRACELVQNDVLDIGLINMEIPNIDKFHSLQLTSQPLHFAVCRDHPLAGEDAILLDKIDGRSIILYNQDSVQNQILQARFSALNIHPRIIMRSSQIPTILGFMRDGSCGCFLYRDVISCFPEIIGVPLVPEIRTRAGLIWRRGRYISSGMQTFLDFCKEYYK